MSTPRDIQKEITDHIEQAQQKQVNNLTRKHTLCSAH